MNKAWWKEAVVYQIYPRSFCDSNNDGIGDLPGIIGKLDYLKELGVDMIWLSPIYRSPNHDNGYDVSDYQDIMAEFGTMADFDELLREVHARGMKLMMDMVLNHSSDEHEWFRQSRQSRDNPYRDWYIWRPGKDGREPNNWESIFRGSVWEFDEATGEYYLHLFARQQPDLNWENPELREAMQRMMRWWLDKGVDGLRLDAINHMSKHPEFPDAEAREGFEYANAVEYFTYGSRFYDYMREIKERVLADYDIMTVGEASFADSGRALEMTNPDTGFLNMIFQFEHTALDVTGDEAVSWEPRKLEIPELKEVLCRWQTVLEGRAWNSQYFGNHDHMRAVSRFGDDDQYRVESAKALATIQFTLCGTPFIYQGEEIGMTNVAFESIDDYRDVATFNNYHEYVDNHGKSPDEVMALVHRYSRDNARTPMQWNDGPNGGFSGVEPWIGVNPNYRQVNVAQDSADPHSILHYYRRLIRLRREHEVLVYGRFENIDGVPDEVFAYHRLLNGARITVLVNLAGFESIVPTPAPLLAGSAVLLLGNYPDAGEDDRIGEGNGDGSSEANGAGESLAGEIALRPFEARIYLMEEQA